MEPTFSVVISNYNCARYLPDAVRSVLAQKPAALEIFIADDGSADDSKEAASQFAGKVSFISVEHGGQARALNAALGLCRGSWTAFLESDDVWEAGKLAEVARVIKENPDAAAVQHGLVQADADLNPLPTLLTGVLQKWMLADFLNGKTLLTGLSGLSVNNKTLKELLPLPENLVTCVDEYLQPRLLKTGAEFHLPGAWGKRRLHGKNHYAGVRADARRLSEFMALRTVLDAHMERFYAESKTVPSPLVKRRAELSRAEWELFLARAQGRWVDAAACLFRAVRLCGLRPYALFKGTALSAALLSPTLYFWAHGMYSRFRQST